MEVNPTGSGIDRYGWMSEGVEHGSLLGFTPWAEDVPHTE